MSEKLYYCPILNAGSPRPDGAYTLAGGWCWFETVEVISRGTSSKLIPAQDLPQDVLDKLTANRAPIAGLEMNTPRLMGIVNTTPDSFSDGGQYNETAAATAHGLQLIEEGADILDIGGESTRPGASFVPSDEEVSRTAPVIAALRKEAKAPISIDTRKADVAQAAINAGASLVNDVYAFTYDPQIADVCAKAHVPLCLMHAQGAPDVMQDDPSYENALLDVYDFLEERISAAITSGVSRENIIVDPGIGFGKTLEHNLLILQKIALFHALGCPILLGASRKTLIGTLSDEPDPSQRLPGSLALAIAGLTQGVQICRVHDIKETKQAWTVQKPRCV